MALEGLDEELELLGYGELWKRQVESLVNVTKPTNIDTLFEWKAKFTNEELNKIRRDRLRAKLSEFVRENGQSCACGKPFNLRILNTKRCARCERSYE